MQRLFAEFLFIMIFINGGKSLNCFVCRSDLHSGCKSGNMNESYSVTCPSQSNDTKMYCRKIEQRLRFKDESAYTSIRECAYERENRSCYFFKWLELAYQETCECESDLCNDGYSPASNQGTLLFAFFIWLLIYLTK